jgi:hypothetical protein
MKNKIGGKVPQVEQVEQVRQSIQTPQLEQVSQSIQAPTKIPYVTEVLKVQKEQQPMDIKIMITYIIETTTDNILLNKLIVYLRQIINEIPDNFSFTKSIIYIYNNIDSNQKQRDAYVKQLLSTSSLTNTIYAHEYTNTNENTEKETNYTLIIR